VRPGDVAVPGVLSSSGMIRNHPNNIVGNNVTESDPPSFLVNAHLVSSEQDDIEQGSTSTSTAEVVRVVDKTTLVKAEPLGDIMMEPRKAGLRELLKSHAVQLFLVVLCMIIVGLVIGVVVSRTNNGSGASTASMPLSSTTNDNDNNNDYYTIASTDDDGDSQDTSD
jgi:hypothetical protein